MNKSTTLKNFNPPDRLSAKYNNLLKIPPGKYNSGNFKSVPREFITKQKEKETAKFPSVGMYRPRHQCTKP